MLLLLMVTPLLAMAALVVLPNAIIALEGKFVPAGPMSHNETTLVSLPVVVPVLNRIVPAAVARLEFEDPRRVHLVMVLSVASLINRIVLVPAVDATVV